MPHKLNTIKKAQETIFTLEQIELNPNAEYNESHGAT